jgi:hypothetical protein
MNIEFNRTENKEPPKDGTNIIYYVKNSANKYDIDIGIAFYNESLEVWVSFGQNKLKRDPDAWIKTADFRKIADKKDLIHETYSEMVKLKRELFKLQKRMENLIDTQKQIYN